MVIPQIHASLDDLLQRLERADKAPRCHHVKANGARCGSPALTGKSYCFFHHRLRRPRRPLGEPVVLPPLEDASGVQCALMEVTEAILRKELDPKVAGLLLYAIQTASANLKLLRPVSASEVVLEDPDEQQGGGCP
jgi:hypothetical protein